MKSSCYREAVEGDTEAVRTVSANSYVADEALKALNGETPNVDMSTSKRLLRKIDLNVMPVGFLILFHWPTLLISIVSLFNIPNPIPRQWCSSSGRIFAIANGQPENTLSYASVMGKCSVKSLGGIISRKAKIDCRSPG